MTGACTPRNCALLGIDREEAVRILKMVQQRGGELRNPSGFVITPPKAGEDDTRLTYSEVEPRQCPDCGAVSAAPQSFGSVPLHEVHSPDSLPACLPACLPYLLACLPTYLLTYLPSY